MKFKKLKPGDVFYCKDDPNIEQPFMKIGCIEDIGERNALDLNTGMLWIVGNKDKVKKVNFNYEIWE